MLVALAAMLGAAACTLAYPLDGFVGTTLDDGGDPLHEGGDASATNDGASSDSPASESGDAGSAYRAVVMSDGPVAYYRLGDTGSLAKDETGAHPGTVIGTLSHGAGAIAGDPDGALVANGQGWIDIAQIYPFVGNASYSIEAWVAPSAAPTLTGVLARNVAKPGSSPSDGYSLYIDTNEAPTMGRWLSSAEQSVAAPSLPVGIFTHVVGTYDGATLRIYLNGTLAASAAATAAIIGPSTDLAIGASRNGTYGYFVGSLDEIALYDRALSPERIAAHHTAGTGP